MKRIDGIAELAKKCTGCMACVDACPQKCIVPVEREGGFRFSAIEESSCVNCGKCYDVCPIENHKKNDEEQHLYAAYSVNGEVRNGGSSGGVFELLANYYAERGYYVCGAAFDGNTLKHRIIPPGESIKPLLKSKYVQSDTSNIYKEAKKILSGGNKVFFCGTPCQVSALVNSVSDVFRENLLTADIICHGVPAQRMFDAYISELEAKHGGEVFDFSFRVKDNRFKHAHGYSYKVKRNGKVSTVNGIYTNSSYYNAFKKYLIFRESCYDCQYSTLNRVSDITLADFWGIEKYGFKGNVDKGVSMIITNTLKGADAFSEIKRQLECREFPIQHGIDSNYCLTNSTRKPAIRDAIIKEFDENGYASVAKKYFKSGAVHRAYWLIPPALRQVIRKIRG